MTTRYSIVNQEGLVVNVLEWAGAEWLPPRNHYVIASDTAGIGYKYDFNTKQFTPPAK